MATQTRRPGGVLLVGAFVVVAVIGSALAGPFRLVRRSEAEATFQARTPTSTSMPTAEAVDQVLQADSVPVEVQRWVYLVVLVVLGLLLAVGLGLLVRWVRRMLDRRETDDVDAADPDVALEGDVLDGATPALREGVRRASQVLEDDVPPGDAVIAAWVALEASAERTGLVRDRAQTATEFTVEVLGTTRADPGATRALLELYLAARYSEHVLTPRDVDRARSSLAAIAVDLTRRAEDA
ncbi:DUF4129 domain-containing protein [Cellulomonas xylanilytica]|uniref:Protein-glutamine gamma-glutamyltransferase-like C-terminal domain-containing protein n=1 Tax=Cellulomonas xylanilytica TaxID=233583 RepID=A0A510V537_9CELL|nr:DUF4129 domain-containing protein [Cellulomonas xylanilytica]GEK21972.1 hypothetical protein CXY01_24920 [Cellulomonas xylanilytica]